MRSCRDWRPSLCRGQEIGALAKNRRRKNPNRHRIEDEFSFFQFLCLRTAGNTVRPYDLAGCSGRQDAFLNMAWRL